MMKYINKAANQMLDEAGKPKGQLWKYIIRQEEKVYKDYKSYLRNITERKSDDDCEEYLLNNWIAQLRKECKWGMSMDGVQCRRSYGSYVFDRMSSRPMGWASQADAMCPA